MPAALLIVFYLAVALAPLALAWAQGAPPRSLWDEMATGAGLVGLAILLAEFPLSGRFRIISGRIGMDVTMRFHQLLARTAVALIAVHPFLYRAERNPPYPWDETRQLTLAWTPEAIFPGAVAWLLLPVLVGLALGRARLDNRYETWRLMHGVGALIIVGFGVWHALVAGRHSAQPEMAAFWLALLGIAALSLVVVYVLKPLMQLRRPWRVTRAARIAERTWELCLAPEGHGGLRYRAGEFVWLNVGHSPFSLHENPFSIASAPAEGPDLRFVIKELGDFTRSLDRIAPGTRAHLDGPFGHLTLAGRAAPGVALIAGGVGIAPMLGILAQLQATGDPRPVTLIYGNRTEAQIVDRAALDALDAAGRVRVQHVLSEPPPGWTGETGMVDAALLRRQFGAPEHRQWDYVLCGPPPMLVAVERALLDMGVPPGNILMEAFSYD